ncbi:MAG: hypothetical protein AAGA56_16040, partial [Myxococcota bacterium]
RPPSEAPALPPLRPTTRPTRAVRPRLGVAVGFAILSACTDDASLGGSLGDAAGGRDGGDTTTSPSSGAGGAPATEPGEGGPPEESCPDPRRTRPTGGRTRYLSLRGATSDGNCDDPDYGSEHAPWGRWSQARACLRAGDTLLIAPGVYDSGPTGVFEGQSLRLDGDGADPIWVASQVEVAPGEEKSVTFRGTFAAHGQGYVLKGIEFVGPTGSKNVILQIPGRHIELQDVFVHGDPERDVPCPGNTFENGRCPRVEPQFDGIKILSDSSLGGRVEDISIFDSEVAFCTEDCIDVTGAKGLRYQGNAFHDCRTMQIKGGTEDVVIEANTFVHMWQGPQGASMSCQGTRDYCGSPDIVAMPVDERFVARGVRMYNNLFADIGFAVINAAGWRDVDVAHNTFMLDRGLEGVIRTGSAGFDFYDEATASACAAAPRGQVGGPSFAQCDACSHSNAGCTRVDYATTGFRFRQNIVSAPMVPYTLREASPAPVAAVDNVFWPLSAARVRGTSCGGLNDTCGALTADNWVEEPGLVSDSASYSRDSVRLEADAFPVDRGASLSAPELCRDLFGHIRDGSPDLGAYERLVSP